MPSKRTIDSSVLNEPQSSADLVSTSEVCTDLFDKDEFVRRNLGDLELSRDVATVFISCAPEYIESIRTALTALNADELRKAAHKLKGAAANLALSQLSKLAHTIETYAKDGELNNCVDLLPELEQKLAQAVEVMNNLIIKPQGRVHQ